MIWWRRDASWARTPIHQYLRRLRDQEAALRSRPFSKSNPKAVSHKDDDKNRPAGMSNLEWAQLQYHERWKRRFEEDPYKALFGASESMLNGKGLMDWGWIHKTFPKWMVEEIPIDGNGRKGKEEKPSSKSQREDTVTPTSRKKDQTDKGGSTGQTYPKKVNINEEPLLKEHEPLFPEPSFRTTHFDRPSWTSGVDSPSDSRRPREQPPTQPDAKPSPLETDQKQKKFSNGTPNGVNKAPTRLDATSTNFNWLKEGEISTAPTSEVKSSDGKATRKNSTARETSFIEEFLTDTPQSTVPPSQPRQTSSEWRQTSLERRSPADFVPKPQRRTDIPTANVTARQSPIQELDTSGSEHTSLDHSSPKNEVHKPENAGKWGKMTGNGAGSLDAQQELADLKECRVHTLFANPRLWDVSTSNQPKTKSDKSEERPIEPGKTLECNTEPTAKPTTTVSYKQALNKLPKDDLDFLSADDIRASMGHQRNERKDDGEVRNKLEKDFEDFHRKDDELHPLIQSKIIGDQHIRRVKRELGKKADTALNKETASTPINALAKAETTSKPTESAHIQTNYASSPEVSVLETGIDFMIKWLHAGGNTIARSFFQDPVDVLADQTRLQDGVCPDPFFKGIVSGIQKSRRATWQVKFDLEEDIKASKPLIERLTNNEKSVMLAAGIINGSVPTNSRRIDDRPAEDRVRVLKRGLLATDDEFKKACAAVDALDTSTPPSVALSRRLRIAANVLQKNAKLTRVMIFGLQTRLESAEGQPSQQSRDLAHRLLALQDTQLALARMVSRRMQALGISPMLEENSSTKAQIVETPSTPEAEVNKPDEALPSASEKYDVANKHMLNALADAKLATEVSDQKTAMEGLSDDGYSCSPKPSVRKPLDVPSPLAHSLFRPFGLQFESLGTENEAKEKAKEMQNAAAQKQADKQLAAEVKKAYEDVYGTITVNHRQVPSDEEVPVETSEQKEDDVKLQSSEKAVDMDPSRKEAASPCKPLRGQSTIQMLKEDSVSPTISATHTSASDVERSKISTTGAPQTELANPSTPLESIATTEITNEPIPAESRPASSNAPSYTPSYRIYCHDPATDELIIAPYLPNPSSSSSIPSTNDDSTPTIPYHIALSKLSQPSKFLPHLPHDSEVIASSEHMLITRSTTAPNDSEEPLTETTRIPCSFPQETESTAETDKAEESATEADSHWQPGINPIDGTTRLSPTGFVGTNSLDLEREFDERRSAASEHHGKFSGRQGYDAGRRAVEDKDGEKERGSRWAREQGGKEEKKGKRIGVGGVAKTAIVAGAWCYVVGVVAELVR
ncbi:hypothetical protein CC80DRAFT_590136 [Byssothecium circinans]|uniref:Uncharacterized protein n=1 Tax=Byssothecium circinans TaxID=147558 RepID=A0A6A5UIA2_9PLEO|nr:hypothetical protein CC80DRAFT_590136 [Byssothecium circinans]